MTRRDDSQIYRHCVSRGWPQQQTVHFCHYLYLYDLDRWDERVWIILVWIAYTIWINTNHISHGYERVQIMLVWIVKFNEGYGTPITNELRCLQILTERYVIHMFMNRLCISDIPTNGILLNQMYIYYSIFYAQQYGWRNLAINFT